MNHEQASQSILIYDLTLNVLLWGVFVCGLFISNSTLSDTFNACGIVSIVLYLFNATLFIKSVALKGRFTDIHKGIGIGLNVLSILMLIFSLLTYCYWSR